MQIRRHLRRHAGADPSGGRAGVEPIDPELPTRGEVDGSEVDGSHVDGSEVEESEVEESEVEESEVEESEVEESEVEESEVEESEVEESEVEKSEVDESEVDGSGGDSRVDGGPGGVDHAESALEPDRVAGPEDRLSDVDEWGRSDRVRSVARTLFDPVYQRWFRVEWEGFDRIPREGPALLVANHAGAIPSDAPVIMHGIEKELGRPVYGMADSFFRAIPFIGTMWSRAGGVAALPDNAYRLLHDQGRLVLVFPEGTKATSKSFGDRYQLRRFGRGGFVEIAIRAGVPIVPIAVMGAEETMPILFRVPALARVLGLPYFPVTANMAVLGPAGAVIPFPAKFTLRVLRPVTPDVPPDLDHYPRSLLMEEAERIRQLLQENVDQMRAARQSVWFG